MKITTIFYSYTGITRGVARNLQNTCGGDLVEVKTVEPYSKISAYTLGCYRARKEECDAIEPVSIDVTNSDLLVIGTPVWAFKATPAMNAAVAALKGCEGKPSILFATCGSQAKDTLPILAKALEAKGVSVVGEFVLNKNDVEDEDKINALITAIQSAESSL